MLYEHQKKIIDLNPDKYLLAHDTGAGKSRTSIELAILKSERFMVICPKSLTLNWQREIGKVATNLDYLIITKETFRSKWRDLREYKTVIVDECHFFLNRTSQMSKSLNNYFNKWNTPYRYLLSATPYSSGPWNIYTAALMLGFNYSYKWFENEFFYKIPMGTRLVPMVRKGIEPQIKDIINTIGSTVTLEECFDVPEQINIVEYFNLTPEQVKGIESITDTEHIVYWTKRHQIENGVLKSDGYIDEKVFKAEKTDRLIELVKEHKKMAIICRYNAQISSLEKKLKDIKKTFIINGKVQNRDEVVQEVERLDDCVILIQSACAEGYELPSIGVIVFASMDFSYVKYKQMRGRFLRGNKLKKNVFIHLLVDNGVDNDVYKNVMDKKDFSFKIYSNK